MADMPSVDKMRTSLLISIKTVRKVDKLAAESKPKQSRNEIVGLILDRATKDVDLDDDDLEFIKQEIRRNREKRNNKKS